MNKIGIYVKAILIPVIAGGIIGFLISPFIDYNTLNMPPLAPPAILFPIIWTILYILMGVSYGILEIKNLNNDDIKKDYYIQLGFNLLWPILFFIFKWRLFSFFWILLLDLMIIRMIMNFYNANKISGLLQIPYLLWSIFATYLNLGIYFLN